MCLLEIGLLWALKTEKNLNRPIRSVDQSKPEQCSTNHDQAFCQHLQTHLAKMKYVGFTGMFSDESLGSIATGMTTQMQINF